MGFIRSEYKWESIKIINRKQNKKYWSSEKPIEESKKQIYNKINKIEFQQ